MRIALVTQTFLPQIGGAEFVIHHLANCWCRQGHEVYVLNPRCDVATEPESLYSVRRFRVLRGATRFGYHRFPWLGQSARALGRALDRLQPEFISAHYGYPTGVWLGNLKPVPGFLVTCHGGDLHKHKGGYRTRYRRIDGLLADALNRSAGAVAISTHARRLMEEVGVEPSNIVDIPNGVDLNSFRNKVDIDIRSKLGLSRDALMILSVGREHPAKAYATGIRAFAQVAATAPQAHYVILGRGTDRWAGLVDELRLANKVIFCPGLYGKELVGAYQQADVYFSPSDFETLSLAVLEAMAAGVPEVVTNVSGSQDVVQDGENGFIIEPGEADAMADALCRLATDASLRQRMRAASLARSKNYGWDRISRLYLEHAERRGAIPAHAGAA